MIQVVGHVLFLASLVFLSAASLLLILGFPRQSSRPGLSRAGLVAFGLGTVSVCASLVLAVGLHYYEGTSLTMLTAVLCLITMFAQRSFHLRGLAAFVAPLATLLLLLQIFLISTATHRDALPPSPLAMVHVGLAIIGQGFSIAACLCAALLILQQQALKRKMLERLQWSFPPLDKVEKALSVCLWLGFAFLSLGLISGAIMGRFYSPSYDNMLVKTVWAIVVWCWYLAILMVKNMFGASRKRVAQMSFTGFFLLAGMFFGLLA